MCVHNRKVDVQNLVGFVVDLPIFKFKLPVMSYAEEQT